LNVLLRALSLEMQIKDQIDHDERITALENKLKHQDHAKRSGQFR
jgi:hypothetical protein